MLVGQVRREGRRRCRRIAELAPLGGVERPRRVVRFARLIQRRGRVLGGPAVRAACGGSLSLACWLLKVVSHEHCAVSHWPGARGPTGHAASDCRPFSTPSRAKRTKIARWRVQRSLILLVQLLLSEQLIPFPFSSPLANHAINELRRPAWPACSAAVMSRVHGVWLGLMPVPELSQGITIFVPALERGRYLFLVLAAMATRDGEGLYPSIPMIRLPSDQCGRIARISLGMVRAWSTDSLVGRKAAAGASRLGTIRAQGSGYRSVVGRWLHARSHRAPVVSGSAWDEQ
jgi:hypothetical protein